VIAKNPIWPATLRQRSFVAINKLCNITRVPSRFQKGKIEWQMRFPKIAAVIGYQAIQRKIDLADKKPLWKFVDHLPQSANDVMHLG